jgi:cytochrome c biogenesis protein CcmG, thiol:disulfide interchange protein DsbE
MTSASFSFSRRVFGAAQRAVALLALASWQAFAASTGDVAPAVALPGKPANIDTAKLKGKVVYVDFWASWCGPCKQSFPWMNEMHGKYAARGLEIVAINVDAKAADVERFLAASPAKFTVAFDPKGDTPKQFAVKAMPTSYLIDGNGKITLVHAGFREADRSALEAAIVNALEKEEKGKK